MARERTIPLVNGDAASWADLSTRMQGVNNGPTVKIDQVASINFKDEVERGRGPSLGPMPGPRTRGKYSAASSIEWALGEYVRVQNELVRSSLGGIADIVFDYVLNWSPLGSTKIILVEITGLRIKNRDHTSSDGSDAALIKTDLDPEEIFIDGVSMFRKRK